MFTCTVQGPPERPVVVLGGSMTLEHATEIHAALSARLNQAVPCCIDLRGVGRFDLSFIQMLVALLKDQTLRLDFSPLPPAFVEFAASVGADSLIKDVTSRIKDNL